MNPSDTINFDENEIFLLFQEAGMLEEPVVNQRRVDQVIERAMHEKVAKELTSFVFEGFPAVMDGLFSAASGKINHPDDDYKC